MVISKSLAAQVQFLAIFDPRRNRYRNGLDAAVRSPHRQIGSPTRNSRLEGDMQFMRDIGAARSRTWPPTRPRSPGELPEDFFKSPKSTALSALPKKLAKVDLLPALGAATKGLPMRTSTTAPDRLEGTAVTIVHLAFLGIVQDIVGFLHFLELVLGRLVIRVHIRVQFPRQFAVRFLNLGLRSRSRNAQNLVVVLCHSSCFLCRPRSPPLTAAPMRPATLYDIGDRGFKRQAGTGAKPKPDRRRPSLFFFSYGPTFQTPASFLPQ
jgi:hypothetical protein